MTAHIMQPRVSERVLTVLKTLNTQQLGEVLLFMEFLKTKEQQEAGKDLFWLSITHEANPNVTLDDVRTRPPEHGGYSENHG
ncbi:hypothetical protein U27_03437 [Candidatus Vecturithrix granuli]|uniref:DUF2281 domain-containing protein n=1 Tax=Vecturithrix granuli TaxID=1499967 RepID=A0A081BVX0_VECG1|nr:hypothetical protein U27_03437 [Candidatus Vecturithrix granuli]